MTHPLVEQLAEQGWTTVEIDGEEHPLEVLDELCEHATSEGLRPELVTNSTYLEVHGVSDDLTCDSAQVPRLVAANHPGYARRGDMLTAASAAFPTDPSRQTYEAACGVVGVGALDDEAIAEYGVKWGWFSAAQDPTGEVVAQQALCGARRRWLEELRLALAVEAC